MLMQHPFKMAISKFLPKCVWCCVGWYRWNRKSWA